LRVESVAVDPSAPGKVYALVGASYFNGGKIAIVRSSDDGNTFAIADVTSQFKAHGNGMGRQGATWSKVASFPVTTTANDNGVLFVLFVVFDPCSSAPGGLRRSELTLQR